MHRILIVKKGVYEMLQENDLLGERLLLEPEAFLGRSIIRESKNLANALSTCNEYSRLGLSVPVSDDLWCDDGYKVDLNTQDIEITFVNEHSYILCLVTEPSETADPDIEKEVRERNLTKVLDAMASVLPTQQIANTVPFELLLTSRAK